ncbi:late embryogenesis abundant protein At1g64065 [Vigna radiata var. radiata]|uniref:Late embryogenesis abundant protein At1g64065 n=1 Tax=Vigna radiata var. radiata TaxID=3916 RepID=A0A1S3VAK9_VIGRR|nr:late embryogenesis abundant protein At1g64065 [Vigna radiata var. radiata]
MVDREQARPLAPAIERPSSEEHDSSLHPKTQAHKKLIKRCACPLISLLLLAILIIVLIFTVFRVKDPVITMNGVRITKLELSNTMTLQTRANMSLVADVSVKNPNVASFRYSNTTTSLYYRGVMVGEARGPPGRAKARRTIRMNVTIDVITDRVVSSPDFTTDLGSGLMTMSSFSRVPGQVKILNLFKRHVVVKMNCSTTFNISTQAIKEQSCIRKVKL